MTVDVTTQPTVSGNHQKVEIQARGRVSRWAWVSHVVGQSLRRALRVLPKGGQRSVLKGCLWLSRRLFELIGIIVETYYGGSPKHRAAWGSRQFFMRHLQPSMTVLDIGCGTGELAVQVAEACRLVLAYDRSSACLRQAVRRHARPNIFYWVADAQQGLPRVRVDAVILSSVLSFSYDPRVFLEALHDVTSILLIRETRFDNCYTVLVGQELGVAKSRFVEFTKDELFALLAESGWRVTDHWDTFDMFLKAEPLDNGTASE